MKEELISNLADELYRAWNNKQKVRPFTQEYPDLSLADAYRIQEKMVSLLEQDGYHRSGRKMGYTNPEMQVKMGLESPSMGYLFSELRLLSGNQVSPSQFIQPGIETEILFHLGKDLVGQSFERKDIVEAVDYFYIAMEIVDMRQVRNGKTQKDSVGDEGAFGAYVVGEKILYHPELDLSKIEVSVKKNGVEQASGMGVNVMGDPINSLVWAANHLANTSSYLRAGEEFLSGSYTPLLAASPGDVFEAVFHSLGSVRISF